MLPARLSEADLEALLSPPAHAVLSHLPANPLRALADRLAAGVEAGAAAEGPMAELGGPEVCEMELALQRAVNAYYQAEPSPSNAGQFIAQQIRPIEFPTGTPKDTRIEGARTWLTIRRSFVTFEVTAASWPRTRAPSRATRARRRTNRRRFRRWSPARIVRVTRRRRTRLRRGRPRRSGRVRGPWPSSSTRAAPSSSTPASA